MKLSRQEITSISASTGFEAGIVEKVIQLLNLLNRINSHPFLKNKLALKGGTALNLFMFDIPRLSVDIDLNYVGRLDREQMLSERPKIEQALQAVFSREDFTVRSIPAEHAGGKWKLTFRGFSGISSNLEVDLNYMFRQPLWEIQTLNSNLLGSYQAQNIPVVDIHELAAGKLAALFARHQARDLFDAHYILCNQNLDIKRLRTAFIVYGANILKLIGPLFLDELRAEFEHLRGLKREKEKRLMEFQRKISELGFFDPACGCGNFLVITYRELRRLEIEILTEIHAGQMQMGEWVSMVNVENFYGIEIEEFPARIAETAMWLMNHQMNLELSIAVNVQRASLPLIQSAHILNENALQTDWAEFAPKDKIDYILGNPPFIGKHLQNKTQNEDMALIFEGVKNFKSLDYVSAWYIKAAEYIQGTRKKVAFVSTNSITMGEQVGILWNELFNNYNIKIHFAHRTFRWTSEARGKAAVHVVIIGFGAFDTENKRLFEYENIKGEPHEIEARNINPLLIDGDDIIIMRRAKPLSDVPKMVYGNKPVDGGNLILSDGEKQEFLEKQPEAAKFIKPLLSGGNYLKDIPRWCLWLVDADPKEIRSMPHLMERIEKVKIMRLNSVDSGARKLAERPTQFRDTKNPESFILVPRVSSERRKYIPIGFFGKDTIVSDTCQSIPDATLYHFGVLTSEMHMAWVKYTCGRLESRFRYSKDIVYNNYPWPKDVSAEQAAAVEAAAQGVLDDRAQFPDSSLADLYDPLTMPPVLVKAHQKLDRAVDKCYRSKPFAGETERLEFLFALYSEYVEPLVN
ncbi:Type I restriction-modification system methyltransferase subunit [Limihaloglobus sulfuriphilus]|uniref:site-specific DNA-methyltransferase (adenine-specific) n=1 Tax=Limihaloglobus sulfuriphilus TaxID=1851148 RepID=A0A1Q2MG93_9BACT|nr:nucleotidyl transferase AbiEii/AbiGii toxin family protein [Limihaloglobus sulfuriphilus]AQQ71701.1 Type I restriction-modification system methyltransferase subunit [Limihaloglobus sulfuriphilus]